MKNTKEYHFKVETIESGQRRPYGDGYFHFIVEDLIERKYGDHVVTEFCTKFVRSAISKEFRKKRMDEEGFGKWTFSSYYTMLEKRDDGKWEYKVTEPSTH